MQDLIVQCDASTARCDLVNVDEAAARKCERFMSSYDFSSYVIGLSMKQIHIRLLCIVLLGGLSGFNYCIAAPTAPDVQLKTILQLVYGNNARLFNVGVIRDEPADPQLPADRYNGRVLKPCKSGGDPDDCFIRVQASPYIGGKCTVDVSSAVLIAHDRSKKVHWHLRGGPLVRFATTPIKFLPDPAGGATGFTQPMRVGDKRATSEPTADTDSAVAYEINVQRFVIRPGGGDWKDCVPSDPIIVNQS